MIKSWITYSISLSLLGELVALLAFIAVCILFIIGYITKKKQPKNHGIQLNDGTHIDFEIKNKE